VNHHDEMRQRRESARRCERSERDRLAELPPAMASPELTGLSETEIVEDAEREARYLASQAGRYYRPGELGMLRRSQRQD
jgi:hypothetical protein